MYFIPTAMRNGLNKTKEYAHVRLYGYELVFLFSSIFYMFLLKLSTFFCIYFLHYHMPIS